MHILCFNDVKKLENSDHTTWCWNWDDFCFIHTHLGSPDDPMSYMLAKQKSKCIPVLKFKGHVTPQEVWPSIMKHLFRYNILCDALSPSENFIPLPETL